MPKQTKVSREAEAIRKLDESALLAQERITDAAEKAQKMIDSACIAATAALEISSRVPDKRNIDGSFQWDRGDRYRRGSDDRLDRLEDKVNGIIKGEGSLKVGAAQRIEQITSVRADILGLRDELDTKKLEIEHLAIQLNETVKEHSQRLSKERDLILEVKDTTNKELAAMRTEFLEQHAKQQSALLWKIISAISAIAFLFLLVTITLLTHTFGSLP